MSQYPDAPRHIPATPALLEGWVGPGLRQTDQGDWTPCAILGPSRSPDYVVVSHFGYQPAARIDRLRLDARRPEVRDRVVRALDLPAWMRDTPGGLDVWQAAGLIACAAAGMVPRGLDTSRWGDDFREPEWETRGSGVGFVPLRIVRASGWSCEDTPATKVRGPETGDAGRLAADTAALANGCALMLDADSMLIPWPGGPRVWRRA